MVKSTASKLRLLFLLTILLSLVLYRSHSNQTSSDNLSLNDQLISTERGNDIMIYTPSIGKPKWKDFDAGIGIDTLWLRLTDHEIDNPKMKTDLLRFYYFLMNNSDILRSYGQGIKFTFYAFPLTLKNFENIIVEKIPTDKKTVNSEGLPDPLPIRDSSLDSMS